MRFDEGPKFQLETVNHQSGAHPDMPKLGRRPSSTVTVDVRAEPRNEVQGLEHFTAMVTSFARVVDHRTYLLRDKMNLLSADSSMDLYE